MHSIYVWSMINKANPFKQDSAHISDRYYVRTHIYVFLFNEKKTRVLIIARWTLKVTLWGYPIGGIYRANLSQHD